MNIKEPIAKKAYDIYAVTTSSPVSFDEKMPVDKKSGDRIVEEYDRQAYTMGITEPFTQIRAIWKRLSGDTDYDKGFSNAMVLALSILAKDKNPVFVDVPVAEEEVPEKAAKAVAKKKAPKKG